MSLKAKRVVVASCVMGGQTLAQFFARPAAARHPRTLHRTITRTQRQGRQSSHHSFLISIDTPVLAIKGE